MSKSNKSYSTLSEALRAAINESPLSFRELERETGVLRQSLMKFARGETSLMLNAADRLVEFFGVEIRSPVEHHRRK